MTTTATKRIDAYLASCEQHEVKANRLEQQQGILVLGGYGASLRVQNDALFVRQGFTHGSEQNREQAYYRGVHGLSLIVVYARTGNVTLDAIKWCASQDIAVTMIDADGSLLNSLTGEQHASAKLRRAQYTMSEDAKGKLAAKLVRKKIEGQLHTIEHQTGLPQSARACEILENSLKWFNLPSLPPWLTNIEHLRTYEGRAANAYFQALADGKLRWAKTDSKSIPPHWVSMGDRSSVLSSNGNARHATSPFHAALNLAYALLENACRLALNVAGFDVTCGILHADKEGRDSLVYDLMELYRPIVDENVLRLFGKLTLKKGDVLQVDNGSVRLNPELARLVLASCGVPQKDVDVSARWLRDEILSCG